MVNIAFAGEFPAYGHVLQSYIKVSPNILNKRKILNDPVHGFITLPGDLFFDILEHRYFQRLRRIKQLGLTHLVYPGALHTRFHHALGAMHLMLQAIQVLRNKGHDISPEEAEGAALAILLHDIGHGPFSHALEHSIVQGMDHEDLSDLFIRRMNFESGGKLEIAMAIFRGHYHKRFLHKMVASQLDMDRLDYLKRDSFFTGVSEGVINSDRIINMLEVAEDELVAEAKGIYSIEKFIIARRLMYWQVYLHRTVLGAEQLLIHILRRAQMLSAAGEPLFATPALMRFLSCTCHATDFQEKPDLLDTFARLDDFDIFTSIKVWQDHHDPLLSVLSRRLVNRQLFRTEIAGQPADEESLCRLRRKVEQHFGLDAGLGGMMVFTGEIANNAYNPEEDRIWLLYRDGKLVDIAEASDQINISVLSHKVTKYFLSYPKELDLS